MRTISELEKDIVNITSEINKEFPELSKYIEEMPIQSLENNTDAINTENLGEYYNSLVEMLEEYSKTHLSTKEVSQSINSRATTLK